MCVNSTETTGAGYDAMYLGNQAAKRRREHRQKCQPNSCMASSPTLSYNILMKLTNSRISPIRTKSTSTWREMKHGHASLRN